MYQDPAFSVPDLQAFQNMGADVVAYMREITSEEIFENFPHVENISPGRLFWALFGADGSLMVLADSESDLTDTAYYNDLTAIHPN